MKETVEPIRKWNRELTLKCKLKFDSHRGQKIFSLPRVVPCFPFTRANAQWVIHGFK